MKKIILILMIFSLFLTPQVALSADVLCVCSYVDNQGNDIPKTTQHFVPNTGPASCDNLAIEINQQNNCSLGNCAEIATICKATTYTYETIRCKCEVYSVQETTVQDRKISFADKLLATIYPNVNKLSNETKEEACNKKAASLNKESQNTTINICKVDTFEKTKIGDEFKLQAPTLTVRIPGFKNFSLPPTTMDESGRVYFPWLGEYIRAIYNFGLIAISILAVLMIIISGIKVIVSGIGGEKKEAYKRISQAIIGLCIAWGSYTILYIINPELLNLRSLGVKLIEPMPIYQGVGEGETGPEGVGRCGGKSGKPQTLATDLGLKGDFYYLSNYSTRYGNICETPATIKAIILHYTATPPTNRVSGIVSYWGNDEIPLNERPGVSCQIILDRDGSAYQITEKLEEKVICHGGASGKNWNIGGIGIEIMGQNSEELINNKIQKKAVGELVKKIAAKYGIPLTNKVENLMDGTGGIFSHEQITRCQGARIQKIDPSEEYMKEIFTLIGGSYVDWTNNPNCNK